MYLTGINSLRKLGFKIVNLQANTFATEKVTICNICHITIKKLLKQCQKVYLNAYVLCGYGWWWKVVDFLAGWWWKMVDIFWVMAGDG